VSYSAKIHNYVQEDHVNSWPILAFLSCLMFLVLFVTDWEMREHLDNLSRRTLAPAPSLRDDPDHLKHVTEQSPFMRSER
jgi:hypothetical protein